MLGLVIRALPFVERNSCSLYTPYIYYIFNIYQVHLVGDNENDTAVLLKVLANLSNVFFFGSTPKPIVDI